MRLRILLGICPCWRTTDLPTRFASLGKSNCLMHRGQAHANCQSAAWHGVGNVTCMSACAASAAAAALLSLGSWDRKLRTRQASATACRVYHLVSLFTHWSAVESGPMALLKCCATASCSSNSHQHPIVHKVLTCVCVCLLSHTPGCSAYRVCDLRASTRCFDVLWLLSLGPQGVGMSV